MVCVCVSFKFEVRSIDQLGLNWAASKTKGKHLK